MCWTPQLHRLEAKPAKSRFRCGADTPAANNIRFGPQRKSGHSLSDALIPLVYQQADALA
jgi:hypothetical protein